MDKVALLIAWTLWHECRGEPLAGKQAVASVIWNTAEQHNSKYDLSWSIMRPHRFSCWNNRSTINMPLKPDIESQVDEQAWADCVTIAQSMVYGSFTPTTTATHYFNPDICHPSWDSEMTDIHEIGKHRFGVIR